MSIMIKGIDMPINCTQCPCSDDETRFCRAANKYIPMLGKPNFCPLAEAEERKTGKWVGIKEYCDYLNENAEREGKGIRYMPSGMNIHVFCNQCWEPNDRRTPYCPNCSAMMVQEGE